MCCRIVEVQGRAAACLASVLVVYFLSSRLFPTLSAPSGARTTPSAPPRRPLQELTILLSFHYIPRESKQLLTPVDSPKLLPPYNVSGKIFLMFLKRLIVQQTKINVGRYFKVLYVKKSE